MPSVAVALAVISGCAAGCLLAVVALLVLSRRRLAAELATIRRRFSECMDLAPFCVYMKDADGRYIYQNKRLLDITRKVMPRITTFIGHKDEELFPVAQAGPYIRDDREVLSRGVPLASDDTSLDSDGSVRHWTTITFPWSDGHGRTCVAGLSIDLTEARQAQEAARLNADRCALALEAGRMGTMTLDLKTGAVETSPVFASLHGRPETKTRLTLEESLIDIHPDDRRSIETALHLAMRNQAPERTTYRVSKPDGSIAWIEFVGQVTLDDEGRPALVRGVGFDVTARQEAFEELMHRKVMLGRLIAVQEQERQTLCHELHDGLIQYAIGAKMILQSIQDGEESVDPAAPIRAAIEALNRGIDEGRQLIRGVRTAVLDDLGLRAAIQDLVDQLSPLTIEVSLDPDSDLDALPKALHTTVYRLLQESLTNVRKHAATTEAAVEIHRTSHDVTLQVRDAGCGFDIAESHARGFGLVGMVERARLAGGSCQIESRPGAGTRVFARLPVAYREDDTTASVRESGPAIISAVG